MGRAQIGLFMPNPLTEVYEAMTDLGYEEGDFSKWEKRVQIFHVSKTGGIAFVSDPDNSEIWWLNAYCPNERPSNNTVKFLMGLAFQSGCKVIRSEVKRAGSAKMLKDLGFQKIGAMLYELRS